MPAQREKFDVQARGASSFILSTASSLGECRSETNIKDSNAVLVVSVVGVGVGVCETPHRPVCYSCGFTWFSKKIRLVVVLFQ